MNVLRFEEKTNLMNLESYTQVQMEIIRKLLKTPRNHIDKTLVCFGEQKSLGTYLTSRMDIGNQSDCSRNFGGTSRWIGAFDLRCWICFS